jgi:uncharacterized protein (TIGR03435 family)
MNVMRFVCLLAGVLSTPALWPQSFEVASVRRHRGSDVFRTGPLTVSGPLVRLEGYTIFGLILDAYHVRDFQISAAPEVRAHPEEVFDAMYDVVARAPGDGVPSLEDVRAMLRNLLTDRLGLAVHRYTKEMLVYALTVEKSGARLKSGSDGVACTVKVRPAHDGRNFEHTFSNCPLESLADVLTNLIGDRAVVDLTGLTGNYDFHLVAIPANRSRGESDPTDISPFTAAGDLGLKLRPQKAQVEILSIDRVESLKED